MKARASHSSLALFSLLVAGALMSTVGCAAATDEEDAEAENDALTLPSGIEAGIYDGENLTVSFSGTLRKSIRIDFLPPGSDKPVICEGPAKQVDRPDFNSGLWFPSLPDLRSALALEEPGACHLLFARTAKDSLRIQGTVTVGGREVEADAGRFVIRRTGNADDNETLDGTYASDAMRLTVSGADETGRFTFSLTTATGTTLATRVRAAAEEDTAHATVFANLAGGCRIGLRFLLLNDHGPSSRNFLLTTPSGADRCPAGIGGILARQ